MSKKKRNREIVAVPLSPQVLAGQGLLAPLPAIRKEGGNAWEATFTEWSCHGYKFFGNKNAGAISIKRYSTKDGKFRFESKREIHNVGGLRTRINIDAECEDGLLPQPVKWSYDHKVTGPDGVADPLLSLGKRYEVRSGKIRSQSVIGKQRQRLSSQACDELLLFDAVRRLPKTDTQHRFDLLESFSNLKTGHSFGFDSNRKYTLADGRELECFVGQGPGTLPYEYWTHDGDPLFYISFLRVLVRDDDAFSKIGKAFKFPKTS
ncbi:hypothetical protein FUAX_38630 (plasmid) [Fulvitalea axinellae]|uniref:DUF3108 domain-containing protein n=1 Tax=Fulvitalea axinellae TaxID=1182444 RepID=A0AAU9CQI4_9BACT|nr:hypothetical protein FUAX_38630 [Fulvitalea axinellae]